MGKRLRLSSRVANVDTVDDRWLYRLRLIAKEIRGVGPAWKTP